jgi:hypothetical protein
MKNRYIAFDIETAKEVPGEEFNWRAHRPLGISCAATLASDEPQPTLWHGVTAEGQPAPKMSPKEAEGLLGYLESKAAAGYKILTWNGLGFDFDVLAEESAAAARCKECALSHVDLMFHAFCLLGYPIGMERAAQGMGLPGKPAGMSGEKAPMLWAKGEFKVVLEYVAQDVRVALGIAQAAEQRGRLEWITRKGTKSSLPLPNGWIAVNEALRLKLPDTAWMSTPIPRRDFTAWFDRV